MYFMNFYISMWSLCHMSCSVLPCFNLPIASRSYPTPSCCVRCFYTASCVGLSSTVLNCILIRHFHLPWLCIVKLNLVLNNPSLYFLTLIRFALRFLALLCIVLLYIILLPCIVLWCRCSSYVGRNGGSQRISLVDSCVDRHGTIMHEFLHAFGFYHEQSRTDRDDWVTINWDNIEPGLSHLIFQLFIAPFSSGLTSTGPSSFRGLLGLWSSHSFGNIILQHIRALINWRNISLCFSKYAILASELLRLNWHNTGQNGAQRMRSLHRLTSAWTWQP